MFFSSVSPMVLASVSLGMVFDAFFNSQNWANTIEGHKLIFYVYILKRVCKIKGCK
jgi:uncharacterized membrane protein